MANRLSVLAKQFSAVEPVALADNQDQLGQLLLQGRVADRKQYEALYNWSIADPAGFWGHVASQYAWQTPFQKKHFSYNFDVKQGNIFIEWFKGGRTNMSHNCLDRHVRDGKGKMPCFLWEGNDPVYDRVMTYQEVLDEVCRLANWMKAMGIRKGDAVAIYMPMVCELPIAMLACARIGAVHSVVFGGFSAESLGSRLEDCKAKLLVTASAVMRGDKKVELKTIADEAMRMSARNGFEVPTVLVYGHPDVPSREFSFLPGRDHLWQQEIPRCSAYCPVEWVDSEHPLFYLYTSGSTGKPKGVLHTTGGFMVYAGTVCKWAFGLTEGDVYWCTADCGWVTGHTALTYGPLLNCVQTVVFEGVPTWPTPSRCWEVVEKYRVKQFYTAPTLLRSLMRSGDDWVKKHDRTSLQVLGSVGEPINPEAWRWFSSVVGEGRCPVVDTWWQTETGGFMMFPLPGAWPEKPGSATLPFFGVLPVVLNEKGQEIPDGPCEGLLAVKQPWPGCFRTLFGDHHRYETTYFAPFPGYYFTGDGCRRDEDGYYWITGRVDDVINVSGHRIGTAELESALVAHPHCAEAAVVGFEHPIKGQGIYAFVTLMEGVAYSEDLRRSLVSACRSQIGAFAAPDVIHWAPGLPKTRSGKIMRRVLRKIATHEEEQLGDLSTLADPGVVKVLLDLRGK